MYLQSEASYALATAATGFDGLVGDVAVSRFELVTSGELDQLTGLSVGQVYSLGTDPGVVSPGTSYPVYKALSADTASLVSSNVGTEGTEVVLPFTVSVSPVPDGVPQAGSDRLLDEGWIPPLPYLPDDTVLPAGAAGAAGPPGFDGNDGEDAPFVPGPSGATGPEGRIGHPGLDGEDGQDALPIPGAAGAPGAAGSLGPPGLDGEDGADAPFIPGPAGPGLSDGDKGDITVSGGGATWNIDARAVTFSELQAIATNRLLGRGTAAAGDVEELTPGTGLLLTSGAMDVGSPYARLLSQTPTSITGAATATADTLHHITGTSADYTITLPAAPASGTVIGFIVDAWASANKQYKLDAGSGVVIAGRTRYLVLLHTNVVLLRWDGSRWQSLVLNLDTPWIDAGASTVTATTTSPTKGGGTTYDRVYWRRSGKDLHVRYEYRHTTAGTAGSGDYLWLIPIGSIDTAFVTAETTVGTLNARATSGVGHGAADTNGAFNGTLVITPSVYDGTRLRCGYFASTSALFMAHNTTPFSGATLRFHFAAAVPMTDW